MQECTHSKHATALYAHGGYAEWGIAVECEECSTRELMFICNDWKIHLEVSKNGFYCPNCNAQYDNGTVPTIKLWKL